MVKNILEDIVYIEPRTDLPIPEGMCVNCSVEVEQQVESILDSDVTEE